MAKQSGSRKHGRNREKCAAYAKREALGQTPKQRRIKKGKR